MPYNLRKRKAVSEPEVKPAMPAAKRKKAHATNKVSKQPAESKPPTKDNQVKRKKKESVKEEKEVLDEEDQEVVENGIEPMNVVDEKEEKEILEQPIIKKPKKTTKTTSKTTKKEPIKEQEEEEEVATIEKAEVVNDHVVVDDDDAKPEQHDDNADKKKLKLTTKAQLIFGEDTCGELGQGDIGITKKSPANVDFNKDVLAVSCGPMHTLTLLADGQVYSYGCNDEGALGRVTDGDEKLEATPTLVPIDGQVVKLSSGDSHSAALTKAGKVLVWGNFRDEHGPIGLTPESGGQSSFKPIEILPEIKFKDIASGSNHMLLLDVDGVVYSFGVGAQGQLGRLTVDDVGEGANSKPITAENRDLFLRPQKVNLKNVDPQRPFVCDAIYAGNFSSFATNTDKKKNRLAGWGLNNYFQLGYKGQKGQLVQHVPKRSTFTCSTSMKGVACGPHHTLFLTRTGRVYAAGRNEYGMLGLGKPGPEVCPAKHIESLGNSVVELSAGINTSFAVCDDGSLYAWGMGGLNLGLKDSKDLTEPTKVDSLNGRKVLSVSTGGSFTSVLVES